jgi:hypothetical protein
LRRSAGGGERGHEAGSQRQHPHENHSTTQQRRGDYYNWRALKIGYDEAAGIKNSSWPGSSRPSTSFFQMVTKNVDARDEPGHDTVVASQP